MSIYSETQNIMENMRNKWYKIVNNAPGGLINKLIIRVLELQNPTNGVNTLFVGF